MKKKSEKLLRIIAALSSIMWIVTEAQCPIGVQLPCTCSSTRYEPVSLICDEAGSLPVALSSIGKPTVAIDSFVISNTPIDTIPAFALQGLSIKRLVFRNNGLQTIDPRAFEGLLPNTLMELEIRNNKLGELPQAGITSLRNLRTLALTKNGITLLPAQAFQNYQSRANLRKLDLSGNRIQDLNDDVFLGLSAIQEISLDKNFLSVIPTAALRPLNTLEDLSIGVNQITDVPIGSLEFPNLKSLSLEVNSLSSIPSESFQGTPNLLYLYLSANKFNAVDADMFRFVPKLKVLAMGNNEIRVIPSNAFQYVPELVRLEMSECSIESLEPGAFQTIRKAQVIVLNRNNIKMISRNTFQGLGELVSLDLKGNDISLVEDRAWSALTSLKHLDISTNKLQTLKDGTFVGTLARTQPPTTRVLYIYENPWVCDNSLQWFRDWLRQNMDIMIDAPGYPPSVCWKPAGLFNWPIRSPDPVTRPPLNPPPNPQVQTESSIEDATKFIKESLINDGPEVAGGTTGKVSLAGVNLAAVILGIILGVLLLSVLLLMVVRYFVSKNRRDRKEEDEEARRLGLGSTISGYHSQLGSAYPSPATPGPGSINGGPPRGYFLNRPWYWWF